MIFQYIIIGDNLAKMEEGGFSGVGSWRLIKCFMDNSEFYINLNKATGEGEIVPKNNDNKELIKAFQKTFK